MANKYLINNLKEVLSGIRKRMLKIEQRRKDYMNSESWIELKNIETKICDIIEKENNKEGI